MQLQVSWIFVWNIQSPSVWPFLESSVDETVKESALMPFNPSRVFVLVRLQIKISDEADRINQWCIIKKGFWTLYHPLTFDV